MLCAGGALEGVAAVGGEQGAGHVVAERVAQCAQGLKTVEAVAPMMLARKVTVLDAGTSVRVIQTSWGNVEVRVLTGPRSGEHWWIDREFLR